MWEGETEPDRLRRVYETVRPSPAEPEELPSCQTRRAQAPTNRYAKASQCAAWPTSFQRFQELRRFWSLGMHRVFVRRYRSDGSTLIQVRISRALHMSFPWRPVLLRLPLEALAQLHLAISGLWLWRRRRPGEANGWGAWAMMAGRNEPARTAPGEANTFVPLRCPRDSTNAGLSARRQQDATGMGRRLQRELVSAWQWRQPEKSPPTNVAHWVGASSLKRCK